MEIIRDGLSLFYECWMNFRIISTRSLDEVLPHSLLILPLLILLFRHINFHNKNEALKATSALRPHLHVHYCKRNYQCQCNISQVWNECQRPQLIRVVGTMQAHTGSSTRRQRQNTPQTCVLASSRRAQKKTILFVCSHVQFSSPYGLSALYSMRTICDVFEYTLAKTR